MKKKIVKDVKELTIEEMVSDVMSALKPEKKKERERMRQREYMSYTLCNS